MMGVRSSSVRRSGAVAPAKPSLIPVLVTGIQCDASASRESAKWQKSFHRADARWLDSCDKHRNEGAEGSAARKALEAEAKLGVARRFFTSPLRGEVAAKPRVGVTCRKFEACGGHPTPSLRADPPHRGEGGHP